MSNRSLAHAVIASLVLVGASLGCNKSPSGPTASGALAVTAVSPSTGPTGGVVEMYVGGAGFQPGAMVTLGDAVANITVLNSTLIKVTPPTHAAGTVDVVVTNPGGQSGTLPGAYTYVPVAVTSISPTEGLNGQVVRVNGTGFLQGATLTLDGLAARVTGITSTVITAVAPLHEAATVDVLVTNPGGQSGTLARGFTFDVVVITASTNLVAPGGQLSVSWVATGRRSSLDWIALLKVGDPSTSYESGWWRYTHGEASGTVMLSALTQPGEYEFRYLLDDDYIDVARSSPVTVSASASPSIPAGPARER